MTARPITLVVVGVDGSEHADRALKWAIEHALPRAIRLRVATAWHVTPVS